MPCESMTDLLSALVDGEVSAEEEAVAASHLGSCPGCRSRRRFLESLKDAVREAPLPRLPEDLRRQLMDGAVRASRPARSPLLSWPRPWSLPGLGYGLAAAAALMGFMAVERFWSPAAEAVPVDILLRAHGKYASDLHRSAASALSEAEEDEDDL